jgi:hypothetical protein
VSDGGARGLDRLAAAAATAVAAGLAVSLASALAERFSGPLDRLTTFARGTGTSEAFVLLLAAATLVLRQRVTAPRTSTAQRTATAIVFLGGIVAAGAAFHVFRTITQTTFLTRVQPVVEAIAIVLSAAAIYLALGVRAQVRDAPPASTGQ